MINLRCEMWLETLSERVDYCLEVVRQGITVEMIEGLWIAVFFVWRECR